MKIRISNNQKIPVNLKKITELVKYAFKQEGIDRTKIEISILLEDDKGITAINKQYLGRARATDVISFRLWEGPFNEIHPEIFGDIVVNVQEAKRRSHFFERELSLYVIHGILHLLGYIDDTKTNARHMRNRCNAILKGWI